MTMIRATPRTRARGARRFTGPTPSPEPRQRRVGKAAAADHPARSSLRTERAGRGAPASPEREPDTDVPASAARVLDAIVQAARAQGASDLLGDEAQRAPAVPAPAAGAAGRADTNHLSAAVLAPRDRTPRNSPTRPSTPTRPAPRATPARGTAQARAPPGRARASIPRRRGSQKPGRPPAPMTTRTTTSCPSRRSPTMRRHRTARWPRRRASSRRRRTRPPSSARASCAGRCSRPPRARWPHNWG